MKRSDPNRRPRPQSPTPDRDGLPNLLEYAFIGDPCAAGSEQPIFGMEGNDCSLTYRRRTAAVDLIYTVEEFSEANGWSSAPFTEQVLSDDGTLQMIKARLPAGSGSEKLIRLRVTRN